VGFAQFCREGLNLGAGRVEGTGTVDGVRSMAKLFAEGELGGNAAAGFQFAHAAGEEAFELLLGSAASDHESIKIFDETGFHKECRLHEDGVADAGSLPGVELQEHGLRDGGMENGIEAQEFSGIGEDDGGEFRTIDAARRVGKICAELAEDFVVCGLAWFHEFVGDGVGVEDREAEFTKD
jgi:hypothetical protein